jgi:hypothetical protein
MKFLLFLLLLANAALFALHQGHLNELLSIEHEPNRIASQFHADQISLLSASVANAPPASDAVSLSSTPATPSVELASKPIACVEIGDFTLLEAKRFEAQLAALALGDRQSRHNVQETTSHIVYIPAQASKEATDKKASELRGLGVINFFTIQNADSPLQGGISLGIFKTQQAAEKQLAILNKQGVHSARVGARSANTNKLMFQLRQLAADSKTRLDTVRQGFPAQDMRECQKKT